MLQRLGRSLGCFIFLKPIPSTFCAFAATSSSPGPLDAASEIFVAVPNTLASDAIDIYTLPSQMRVHTLKAKDKTGMAMCLALLHHNDALTLIAAFENGYTTVQRLESDGQWTTTYHSQAHSQPVLSLSVYQDYFITSSADSIVAKHPIPSDLFFPIENTEPQNSTERVVEIIEEPKAPTSLFISSFKRLILTEQQTNSAPERCSLERSSQDHQHETFRPTESLHTFRRQDIRHSRLGLQGSSLLCQDDEGVGSVEMASSWMLRSRLC
ncbi:hypothetical protein CEP52_011539 [Fusarium oligoseptatum]|uniref:Uncharacterized protein n=1 Tax=Fusarium oligoseptatum TaxID=2604345 RepID=A0A428T2R9_9HYPO|nr:hypothetical protein CEP52_011539 [Fusarium oligoseptatum]